MISKARIKQIHGLERKKNRQAEGLFVAEGPKLVGELLGRMPLRFVAATEDWLQACPKLPREVEVCKVSPDELHRASLLQHPQSVVALFEIPHDETRLGDVANHELVLALDGVQDPGNLGTIVRLADWFGIQHIFCSHESADIFNPKATQATMGALGRVAVHYTDLAGELASVRCPIYGTFLDGENIYGQRLTNHGVIVMGNEGKGITKAVAELVSHRLFIPPYPSDSQSVESLNVAIATAIVCAEFRRSEETRK